MKILIITNYYPPCDFGWGYMQLCEEVADGLSSLGHQITVLTSHYGSRLGETHRYPVIHALSIDPDWNIKSSPVLRFFVGRHKREQKSRQALIDTITNFSPELIFVWHAIGLSRKLLKDAELSGVPVVYYLAGYLPELPDEYLAYWTSPAKKSIVNFFKRAIASFALRILRDEGNPVYLDYKHVICVSEFVRNYLINKNLITDNSIVIYNGIDPEIFKSNRERDFRNRPIKCLIAGRVTPEKGIHTTINAMSILKAKGYGNLINLTLLGSGRKEYIDILIKMINELHIEEMVIFKKAVERSKLPEIMDGYDILLLPSEYDEPIARSMQEGMAIGLLVIGTTTGGSGELLKQRETGVTFQAGDANDLVRSIEWVFQNPDQAFDISKKGRIEVLRNFTIQKTIKSINDHLVDKVS